MSNVRPPAAIIKDHAGPKQSLADHIDDALFEPTTAQKIRPWNKNHMAFPELACVGRPRGKVAFHAHCATIQRSRILAPAS